MRVLIVGNGFIGSHVAKCLLLQGDQVCLASRRQRDNKLPWTYLDATDQKQCAVLLAAQQQFDIVVLAHGPSDITWCDSHASEAMAMHLAMTQNFCQEAPHAFKLMISTDNVFPGVQLFYAESDNTMPKNAYGYAKLAAERVLLQHGNGMVLRTSLVYGWEDPKQAAWLNFFSLCVSMLRQHKAIAAPVDHWNTPILVDDVASVVSLLLRLHGSETLLHLAGPDRVSRAEWADVIANIFDFDRCLVKKVARQDTRYACRPENACLISEKLEPFLHGYKIKGIVAGAKQLRVSYDKRTDIFG